MKYIIKKSMGLNGEIDIPGDKSISHRALMIGTIADGITEIDNFLMSDDCMSTINCLKMCGGDIKIENPKRVIIKGNGLYGLKKPIDVLDAKNSGTTMRLLCGILSSQKFDCKITGDESLLRRPMGRVTTPLRLMGAKIEGKDEGNFAPLYIKGSNLKGIEYYMPVLSAQVKSAILLASLYAEGETVIHENIRTRDHTERMLKRFGAEVYVKGKDIFSYPVEKLSANNVFVPGDISAASFFMVAASIIKGSSILMRNIGINPTRCGVINALLKMGADIKIENIRDLCGEPVGDIVVKSSRLHGIVIDEEDIPSLIDEVPVLCVAAAFAEGMTIIRGAFELRHKESDRIKAMAYNLKLLGAEAEEIEDGLIIKGGRKLHGNNVKSFNDHRIAMAMAVAGLMIDEGVQIENAECVTISFPGFFEALESANML